LIRLPFLTVINDTMPIIGLFPVISFQSQRAFHFKKKILHLASYWFIFDLEPHNSLTSSIIEEYYYNIFIGCCQEDNNHDEQIAEFVDNMSKIA